jgi:integrase
VFLTLADTGARPGKVLALQWPDLDLASQTVQIERALSGSTVKATKTGQVRTVELTPRLVAMLNRWQLEREAEALQSGTPLPPWIFPSPTGEAQDQIAVGKRFQRLLVRAKLPRHVLYDLRHSYATHSLANGAPITWVAAQMGHSNPSTTLAFYAHWLPRAERVWARKLEQMRVGAFHDTTPVGATTTTEGVSQVA